MTCHRQRALRSARMFGVLAVCAMGLAQDVAAASPSGAVSGQSVVIAGRVAVPVPLGMMSRLTTLGPGADALSLTDGAEALVVSVYSGPARPSSYTAQQAHIKALRERIGASQSEGASQRLLGSERRGEELRFKHSGASYRARVVAASSSGFTVVAVWTWPDGLGSQLVPVVERLWLQ